MKNILLYTLLIILVPFFIIIIFDKKEIEEITLNYQTNTYLRVKRNKTNIIEEIELEEYIVGVLAGEMPISFHKEALKAQAVASRSYALKKKEYNKDNEYDVEDSISNQVYLDLEYLRQVWKENYIKNINKLREAVNETSRQYLTYDDKIVDAFFFSTSNGYTEDSKLVFGFELPYLKSVESSWDKETSSVFNHEVEYSLADFYDKLDLDYQKKLNIEIIERSSTNRIIKLKINNQLFLGTNVRNKLNIKSTDFNVIQNNNNVTIKTTGCGHGVGMSQYGALGMAKKGYKYEEILKYYYKDTSIKKLFN